MAFAPSICATTNRRSPDRLMALKPTTTAGLNEHQRLERLTKLCEDLQAAVDRAGDQRRVLEEMKQVAQDLLSDAESKPVSRKRSPKVTRNATHKTP